MNSNKNHVLTFELDPKTRELEIHANIDGLKILREKIDMLIRANSPDHTHLMSQNWGGEEITNQKQSDANEMIKSVKIFKWN